MKKQLNELKEKTYTIYSTPSGEDDYSCYSTKNHDGNGFKELSGLKEGDKFYIVTCQYNGKCYSEEVLREKPNYEKIEEFFQEMRTSIKEGYDLDDDDDFVEMTKEESIQYDYLNYCRIIVDECVVDPSTEEGMDYCNTKFYAPTEEDTDK